MDHCNAKLSGDVEHKSGRFGHIFFNPIGCADTRGEGVVAEWPRGISLLLELPSWKARKSFLWQMWRHQQDTTTKSAGREEQNLLDKKAASWRQTAAREDKTVVKECPLDLNPNPTYPSLQKSPLNLWNQMFWVSRNQRGDQWTPMIHNRQSPRRLSPGVRGASAHMYFSFLIFEKEIVAGDTNIDCVEI